MEQINKKRKLEPGTTQGTTAEEYVTVALITRMTTASLQETQRALWNLGTLPVKLGTLTCNVLEAVREGDDSDSDSSTGSFLQSDLDDRMDL